jgi:HPt (histidine-containing phosphotransfer) domain-containing protein
MDKLKAQVVRLERTAAESEQELDKGSSVKQGLAKSQATIIQLKKEVSIMRIPYNYSATIFKYFLHAIFSSEHSYC